MKRIISVFLSIIIFISVFPVMPNASFLEKFYFNADFEACSGKWFYYVSGGEIFRETNKGENKTYFPIKDATRLGVCDNDIYYLNENGIIKFNISNSKSKVIVNHRNIEDFSYSENIIYYLADGIIHAKNILSGETKTVAESVTDFWLENANEISYMSDEYYISTLNFSTGEVEKKFNFSSELDKDLLVKSDDPQSQTGYAPQGISLIKLRDKFPAGQYWNHGKGANNPNGYTSNPCNHHTNCDYGGSCGCNSFNSAIQCMGYAYKCGYDVTGEYPRSSTKWKKLTNSSALDNLKAGDMIRYKNDGHSVYVIGVSADTVTITDCNSDHHCIIRWDATLKKSTIKSSFSYIRSAPFEAAHEMELNPCGGSCDKKSIRVINGENYGELPTPQKEGYDFAGWFTDESAGTRITADSVVDLSKVRALYAHWTIKVYTISYDANGGTNAPQVQKKKYGETISINGSAPDREGYKFNGWNDAPDGSGEDYRRNQNYKNNANITLYAQWEAKKYMVSFNADGGSGTNLGGRTVTFAEPYGKLPPCEKTGYDFVGWYNQNGELITEESRVSIAAPHTLTARWSEKEYPITYNGRGNGNWPNNQTKKYFSTAIISDVVPTSDGMEFIRWSTNEDGSGKTYRPGEAYNSNEPLTLWAQWNREKYDVAYNPNGGTGSFPSQIKEYGIDLTLHSAKPIKTGYTFEGWVDKNGARYNPSDVYKRNEPASFVADWSANKYTVRFDSCDGVCKTESKSVTYDKLYGTLPETSRAGYIFMGWFTEKTGGNRVNAKDTVKITDNCTLYAHWEHITYDVRFVSDGEEFLVQKKQHGTDLKLSYNIPLKEGYEFVEWNTEENGGGASFAPGSVWGKENSIVLYAIWQRKVYSVKFNANGGSNPPRDQIKYHSESIKITSIQPEKAGYEFVEWNSEKNGGGVSYHADDKYSADESIILYAQWEAKQFNIFFKSNGETASRKIGYGEKLGELPVAQKDGFRFICWRDEKGNAIAPYNRFYGEDDITLTAEFISESELSSGDTYYALFIDNGKTVGRVAYSAENMTVVAPQIADIFGYVGEWEEFTPQVGGIIVFSNRKPIKFTAEFICADSVIAKKEYTIEDKTIDEPEIPQREGYIAKWQDYTLGGNIEIRASYVPIEYDAVFIANGREISRTKYTVGVKSISVPRMPERRGYEGRWENFEIKAGGITVYALYSMRTYTAVFMAEGKEIATARYTIDSVAVNEPKVPAKDGHTGKWEEYSFQPNDIVINAVYSPNDYSVTFVAEGITVATVGYTFGESKIDPPEIPNKTGYSAKWGEYTLGSRDSTVNAIYTPIVYTVTFKADGITLKTDYFTVESEELYPPEAPEKEGCYAVWEYEIRAENMTVEAKYNLIQKISIAGYKERIRGTYLSTTIYSSVVQGMLPGYEVHWFLNGDDMGTGDENGKFRVSRAKKSYTVQTKMINSATNEVVAESEIESVYIPDSIYEKFMTVFRFLFGKLRPIEQK